MSLKDNIIVHYIWHHVVQYAYFPTNFLMSDSDLQPCSPSLSTSFPCLSNDQ
jgi:hypothetical protein